jgi:hypothetical protein
MAYLEKDPPTPSFSASSGNDPVELEEAYGPIGFRRYEKGDGRTLILYTYERPTDGGSADEGPARE